MKYSLLSLLLLSLSVLPCYTQINNNIRYILHVTDIHYDHNYYVTAPNNCIIGSKTGMGCCRKDNIPLKPYNQCSIYGDYKCDVPKLLVNDIFNWTKHHIYNKNIKFDYIIYTGDSPGHHIISQSLKGNLDSINTVNNIINKYYPNIPLYQTLGNHDTYPIDQTESSLYRTILNNVSHLWSKWLTAKDMNNVIKGGYYSTYLYLKMKLISFNSIFYDTNNLFKVKTDNGDNITGNQWIWLENELYMSFNNSEKVILITHIPPGSRESSKYYIKKLIPLISKYRDTIKLQLFGHSHYDRFILYNETYNGFGILPGSLMSDNHDPNFRIIVYDNSTMEFIDYIQYSCPLKTIIKENNVFCINTYNFTTEYNVSNISTKSFVEIYNKMKNNDTNTISKYNTNYKAGNSNYCNNICLRNYLKEIII